MGKYLQVAQKLYDEGKWLESNVLIDNYLLEQKGRLDPEEIAEAHRLKGWNWYYIGTKGLRDKQTSLQASVKDSLVALDRTSESKTKISVLNVLPLSLWILGKLEEAWQASDRAIAEFPDEPSVWNTRSILFRWAKDFKGSVEVCEMVYEKAIEREDYRTAGHGKQNQGDALKALGLIKEAQDAYAAAVGLYKKFEEKTGQSAQPHIKSSGDKLESIS